MAKLESHQYFSNILVKTTGKLRQGPMSSRCAHGSQAELIFDDRTLEERWFALGHFYSPCFTDEIYSFL